MCRKVERNISGILASYPAETVAHLYGDIIPHIRRDYNIKGIAEGYITSPAFH